MGKRFSIYFLKIQCLCEWLINTETSTAAFLLVFVYAAAKCSCSWRNRGRLRCACENVGGAITDAKWQDASKLMILFLQFVDSPNSWFVFVCVCVCENFTFYGCLVIYWLAAAWPACMHTKTQVFQPCYFDAVLSLSKTNAQMKRGKKLIWDLLCSDEEDVRGSFSWAQNFPSFVGYVEQRCSVFGTTDNFLKSAVHIGRATATECLSHLFTHHVPWIFEKCLMPMCWPIQGSDWGRNGPVWNPLARIALTPVVVLFQFVDLQPSVAYKNVCSCNFLWTFWPSGPHVMS